MSCLDNTGLLRFLDGSMAAEDLGVIEEHLDHCELCRGLVATLVQVRSAAASQPPPTERASRALTAMDEQADGEGRCHMRRYVLLRLLGQGGMGQVFRAKDRQSGQIVALKRVSQHAAALNRGELAALSEEFRILSSLRHPCIISVLDYGFDSRQRPYFTMEFLEGACPVLPVAATAPRDVQVALLCQILQALGYLHRRRVLHRDLKPSNILLVPSKSGPTVKIVDFGLSLTAASPSRDHAVGTLSYMAPELLCGHAASRQSDLYAVGVIAYEIFAGRHPFPIREKPAEFIAEVLHKAPDLLLLPDNMRAVIGTALSKSPVERQPDAATLFRELVTALGGSGTSQPLAARDSYLAAAAFTGRTAELSRLRQALQDARRGRGSGWLVAGESGVGKSRLLEELRSHALLDGFIVVRGQATPVHASPYGIWHKPLRALSLHVELSDEEARVLAAVVPELGRLLERRISPIGDLDAQGTRLRLLTIVRAMIGRQEQPLLFLLDDLQWAQGDSLELLQQLLLETEQKPLMIVASRRDETSYPANDLLERFPQPHILRLPPLRQDEIGLLCNSMLGTLCADVQLRSLIEQKTAGNPYFVVEALRALSEEADSSGAFHPEDAAQRVLLGGVTGLLQRRLARLPEHARPLLQVAAVAGRWLDLQLLRTVCEDLEALLQILADHGILEVHEERWRFVHDKLREQSLQDMEPALRRKLHARIAQGMAAVYADGHAHTAQMAYHYKEAGQEALAALYYGLAGQEMLSHGAPVDAEAMFEQALALQDKVPVSLLDKVRAARGHAQTLHILGKLEKADAALRRVCSLLDAPLPTDWARYAALMMRSAARILGAAISRRLHLPPRCGAPEAAFEHALKSELVLALTTQEIYVWLARPELALVCTLWGIGLEESLGELGHRTNFRTALALLVSYTPLHGLGVRYLRRLSARPGAEISAQIDYLCAQAISLTNQGRWAEASASAEHAAALARAQPDLFPRLHCLLQLQLAANGLDDFARILAISTEMEMLAARAQNPLFLTLSLIGQSQARLRFAELDLAEQRLRQARSLVARGLGPVLGAIVQGMSAVCAWLQGRQQLAEAFAAEAVTALRQIDWPLVDLRYALACVLEVYLVSPDSAQHKPVIEEALRRLARIAHNFPFARPSALLYEGRHEWAQGHASRGKRHLLYSLRAAQSSGSRYEQAQAHYWLGRMLLREHARSEAAIELKTALALFESLGAVWDAAAVRAAQQEPSN